MTHLPLLAMPMFSLHSTLPTNLLKGLLRVETSNIYDFPPPPPPQKSLLKSLESGTVLEINGL